MHYFSRSLLVLSLLGSLAGATSSASAAIPADVVAPRARHVITFSANAFQYSPADITIFTGDEVEWSGLFGSHPLASDDNLWPVVSTGDTFRFTFTQPGIYRYYCQFHGGPGGIGMSGVVRVAVAVRTYVPVIFG